MEHVRTKHGTEYDKVLMERTEATKQEPTPPPRASPTMKQPTLHQSFEAKTKYNQHALRKQLLDQKEIQMITWDMQPLSIVQDEGFRELMQTMDPKYDLISRRTIGRRLPALYEERRTMLAGLLSETDAVTLTTDIWTSRRTEAFITVTAHFITPSWELHGCVLDTLKLDEAHTAKNIAEVLSQIMESWQIRDKVFAIVKDNASNMIAAVDLLKIRRMPCFAHTLNLVVTDDLSAVKSFETIRQKVKRIAAHFHHCVNDTNALKKRQQEQGDSEKAPLALINDVETRWNSCYDMLERYNTLHTEVTTSCASRANRGHDGDVWGESDNASQGYSNRERPPVADEGPREKDLEIQNIETSLSKTLLDNLTRRFPSPETVYSWAVSTYLDPRFKRHAFSDASALDQAKRRLTGEMSTHQEQPPVEEPAMDSEAEGR
ncbi:zinc finger BED domain-containing protein 4-like [Aplysia californica]|uniref:Zinc finger BED domain-containing protein 4-like n=1 Tax=Aplysia californica TaxID=6500 RepID=A0ABM0JPE2_APLCA|nr:zinc finger BED domain-containing protein 4-like [Aplysia californica]